MCRCAVRCWPPYAYTSSPSSSTGDPMLICVIREIAGSSSAAQKPGTLFDVPELTLGSSPDQLLQVTHPDVEPHPAPIRFARGRLLLTALPSKGVMVNG